MKGYEVLQLLKDYLEYYHLEGWNPIVENRSTNRFGYVKHSKKEIGMSRKLSEINPKAIVERVIRHEVAHALLGKGVGHNMLWKRTCISIGGDGKTKYSAVDTNTMRTGIRIPLDGTKEVESIPMPTLKTKTYSWVNKKGQTVTITERYKS